ncbi:beta-2-microglobulin [Ammospiza nelsoni]|uniref:beta-2-microglobulin n=1 Tax=Ammospiza caudacuta TaxID=2857398 RepID=UPI00273A3F4F|nr:beta-2-microglobulin [Ammospiza caudacuta]XP_059338327.1 beta-2-microglobulin [Ammospiza nelsoni]XP_059338328.1 beta-2-microglobulin [Ammospiza nelsoni]
MRRAGRGGTFRETAGRRGAAMARRALALGVLALLALLGLGAAAEAPKVEVYARSRAEEGKENTLHCFVTGFHPPRIDIELLKNGVPIPDVTYGDLSFNDKWQFQRLVYAPFTPTRDDIFSCRVAHSTMPGPHNYIWEPDF